MPNPYSVLVFGLDNAGNAQKVLSPGAAYDAVQVVQMPLGADVKVRLGQSADPIPVTVKDGWADLCGQSDGIYVDVAVGSPGDTISLLVFWAGGGTPLGVA